MVDQSSDAGQMEASDVLERYKREELPEFVGLQLDDVNQVGNFGDTPLHVAAIRGCLGEVEGLLAAGARVDARGEIGNTPLHEAIAQGLPEVVDVLLANGASMSATNDDGVTPLDLIRKKRDPDIAAQLEAVHSAAGAGDFDRIQELIAQGYPIEGFDELGKTPLHYAVEGGHVEVAALLIQEGADVNAHAERLVGNTPLGEVAGTCSLEMATLLIDAGADPSIPGWMQLTALYKACKRKRGDGPAVCELLRRAAESRESSA